MKKILVLGKGSFVGNSFIEYINKNYPDDYVIHNIVSTDNAWKKLDFGQYDAVYNVAGLAHVKAKANMERKYYAVNRDLPVAICKKVKADGCSMFIHMSSMIVYGGMSKVGVKKVISEDTIPDPENFYGDSKLQADKRLIEMIDNSFHVVILRPPLLYSQNARDNFPRLIKFARTLPIFPTIKNEQSMLYVYNMAELIRLIIESWGVGIYYPQNREYTCTSEMVKKFSDAFGHKMYMTGLFNSLIKFMGNFIPLINKAFGDLCYEKELSGYYDWAYCIDTLDESIQKTVESIREREQK